MYHKGEGNVRVCIGNIIPQSQTGGRDKPLPEKSENSRRGTRLENMGAWEYDLMNNLIFTNRTWQVQASHEYCKKVSTNRIWPSSVIGLILVIHACRSSPFLINEAC
jgi:hypothetical protein